MNSLPDVSRLRFDEKKHAYTLDGKLLSGVTTVIDGTSSKQNLIQWAANMAVEYVAGNSTREGDLWMVHQQVLNAAKDAHTKKKDKAASRGTDTHALVEKYINLCMEEAAGRPETWGSVEWISPIRPFVEWAMGEVKYFVAVEQRLYDEENGIAGTMDFAYVSLQDEFVTADLKSYPKMWSADAFIQLGIYTRMWRLLTGTQATKSVVVKMCDPQDERLRKYGGKAFAVYPRYALQEDEEMFLKRLDVYRYNQNFVSPTE